LIEPLPEDTPVHYAGDPTPEEIIREEVAFLCTQYVEKTGMKPSPIVIRDWTRRLHNAYYKLEVIDYRELDSE